MTANPGVKRFVRLVALPLALAAAIALGMVLMGRDKPATQAPQAPRDGKESIFQFLVKKSKQKDFKPPFDFDLPDRVAALRTNAQALEQRMTGLRTALRGLDDEQAPLRKAMEALRAETQQIKQAAGAAKAALKEAESRPQPDSNEIAARQTEAEAKSRAWDAKREQIAPLEVQLASKTQERTAALGGELRTLEAKLQTVRAELRGPEEELGGQENGFIRAFRAKVDESRSYEALYQLIGQQLTAADRLLADADIERQQMGLNFAREACRHALNAAESPWLAARICEVYLWPNLERADYTPASKERTQDLLHLAKAVFSGADEGKNLERNYELMIEHAPNRRHADGSRLDLAELLEQAGNYGRAAQFLQEVQEPEVLPTATQRLARIIDRLPEAQ